MNRLYKFVVSQTAVQKLLDGWLRFSTTEELNNPCELLDEINEQAVFDSLESMRRIGYSEDEYDWLRCQGAVLRDLAPLRQAIAVPPSRQEAHRQIKSSFYDDIPRMARLQREAVREIRRACGILSLTSRYDSLPMWAHYAQTATGFAVLFDNLDRAFPGDDTRVLNQVRKIEYSDVFTGMTFVPSSQRVLFFWKMDDWSYEQEYRVVSALAKCSPTVVSDRTLHLRRIDPSYVSGMIIGWKAAPETTKSILAMVARADRPIDVFQARVDRTSVVLDMLRDRRLVTVTGTQLPKSTACYLPSCEFR